MEIITSVEAPKPPKVKINIELSLEEIDIIQAYLSIASNPTAERFYLPKHITNSRKFSAEFYTSLQRILIRYKDHFVE